MTDGDGRYAFTALAAGTYCVTVAVSATTNAALLPGDWTAPAAAQAGAAAALTVALTPGERKVDVNFGWDYQFLPP